MVLSVGQILTLPPPPTTPFGIPAGDPGFFTFNPGDGQCAPYNLFGRGFGGSVASCDGLYHDNYVVE